ncbi:MAG: MarR family winged helix-turn-helix transcriptional regulator [Acidimicrobiales bacterium]
MLARPRWLNDNEQAAWRAFQEMQMRLSAQLARDVAAHSNLSYADYVVLVVLTEHPEGVRLFELGMLLGWEKSRTSHQVDRMKARGLVEKCACDKDHRGAVVYASAQGRQEIAAAAPSHVAAVRRLFIDLLSPAQLGELRRISETVLGAIKKEEGCCVPSHQGAHQGSARP